jgi:hypothetical protein
MQDALIAFFKRQIEQMQKAIQDGEAVGSSKTRCEALIARWEREIAVLQTTGGLQPTP